MKRTLEVNVLNSCRYIIDSKATSGVVSIPDVDALDIEVIFQN